MGDSRKVFVLILAVTILQLSGGLLGVLTPLGLKAMGAGPVVIGLVAALNAAGFMIGAWTAPRALSQFGNIRLFAAAAAVSSVSAIAMGMEQAPWAWGVVRIVQGVAFAYLFTSAESWLGQAIPKRSRGSVMSLYHVALKLALMVGPFFVIGLSPLDVQGYSWAALFLALALVPVCLTRQAEPPPPDRAPMSLTKLTKLAPAAIAGAIIAGITNTGTLALVPIYFEDFSLFGGGTLVAAIASAAAWLGGLVLQYPAGRLSDRVERRLVIAAMAALSGLAALGIALFGAFIGEFGVLALLVIWGAGALSFYGICVAHAIDRTPEHQIPQMMSGILFVWAGGSIIGPVFSGLAMRAAGGAGLFGLAAAMLFILSAIMMIRSRQRAAPAASSQEDFTLITPTPLASADLDPRSPE